MKVKYGFVEFYDKEDKVYFDSESLSRILTFSSKDITRKENLKKAQIVVSPFLTKSYVDKVGENCALYTMERELKKHGYRLLKSEYKRKDMRLICNYNQSYLQIPNDSKFRISRPGAD